MSNKSKENWADVPELQAVVNDTDLTSKVTINSSSDAGNYSACYAVNGEDLVIITRWELWEYEGWASARFNIRVENSEEELLFFGEKQYDLEPDEQMIEVEGADLWDLYNEQFVYLTEFHFDDTFRLNPVAWVKTSADDSFYLIMHDIKEVGVNQ